MLTAAQAGGYAVIAPDFPSLFLARLLIDTAEAARAPVLLSHAPSLKPSVDLRQYRAFIQAVRAEAEASTTAVGLHLDHAERFEDVVEAVELGFTSVMIDASQAPWEENVSRTRRVVELARAYDVAVEAEIGHVGASGSGTGETDEPGGSSLLTDPDQAAEFVRLTGVDALAISIGTIHGAYTGEPRLDFARLAAIRDCVPVPLVLHGGSGTGEANLREVVRLGIRKINLWSDLMVAVQNASPAAAVGSFRSPNDLAVDQRTALAGTLNEYFRISGSAGQSEQRPVDVVERVRRRFNSGYACSEAIFTAFAEEEGYASDAVQLTLSLMGGGICRQGKTCGIVTGALAVLAQRHSHVNPGAREARNRARSSGIDFIQWFEREFGSSDCQTLTCLSFKQPDDYSRFLREHIAEDVCMPMIQAAARRLVEEVNG
jgi:ketose-bisphosphate aldolase/C_GCAxxG_C_C family probable redox protein